MFLALLEKVFAKRNTSQKVSITVYEAKQQQYPKSEIEWNSYHGILLPGSFSSAYDDDDWIQTLKDVIQSEIHPNCRKTLAVCFGHQIFAHSFQLSTTTSNNTNTIYNVANNDNHSNNDNNNRNGNDHLNRRTVKGCAKACPHGTQIGHREFVFLDDVSFTERRNSLLLPSWNKESLSLSLSMLYTHGDMVVSLPSHCAVSLGGTSTVPIQAAAYFGNDNSQKYAKNEHPYAWTFQGHPEYASSIGMQTFLNILKKMESNKQNPPTPQALEEARNNSMELIHPNSKVESDCVHLMTLVAKTFHWIDP